MFESQCAFYLSIGMTYDQYWYGENEAPRYYRKAYELSRDRRNTELWLQGLYVYKTMERLYPIYNPMTKKGTTVQPYLKEPLPLTEAQREEQEARKRQEELQAFVKTMKSRSKSRREADDGG